MLISEDKGLSTLTDNSLPGRIAVTDNPNYSSLERELVILAGDSKRDDLFSSTVADAKHLLRAIRRAFCHLETQKMNMAASQSARQHRSTLEQIALNLASRINNLANHTEVRLAFIEQMPVAATGIDAKGSVVLINNLAKVLFDKKENLQLPARPGDVFPAEVCELLKGDLESEFDIELKGKKISVRKSPFTLSENEQGLILLFWEN